MTAAKDVVLSGDLLVVASPVYKASFTGLLKAFLDQFGHDGLACPTRGLFVQDHELDTLDQQLASWLSIWGDVLIGAAAGRAPYRRSR